MTSEQPDTPALSADELAAAAWLTAQPVAPSRAFRERGRAVVRRALRARSLRRRAAVLLASGWLALALAAAVVVLER